MQTHTPFTKQERDHIFESQPISLTISSKSMIIERSSSMYRNDYESMLPMRWLRSQAINILLKILHCQWVEEVGVRCKNTPPQPQYVKIMDTFLVTMIMTTDQQEILSSLAGLELFGENTKYLIIPINTQNSHGSHWQLLLYQNGFSNSKSQSKLIIFDSTSGGEGAAHQFITKIHLLHKVFNLPQQSISLSHAMNLPKQYNNYDCGIFAVGYCEYILREILRETLQQLKGEPIKLKWSSMKEIGSDILDQQGKCRQKYRIMVQQLIRMQIK